MKRFAAKELDNWLKNHNRKPMVLRGARQVGKTWLVRDLAKRQRLKLIELNFERLPNLADLFSENNPEEILRNIEAELATTIRPYSSLLFLDEIQAAPELFSKLRWFKEDMQELPVVAAGSLLDFALNKYQYSMPVGRITYFHLEQLSFFEFVLGTGNEALYKKLLSFSLETGMPESLHEKCMGLYHDYCLVGGMPEVVQEWVNSKNLKSCIKIQQDLLATYRDDFHKYGGEIDAGLLNKIMLSVAEQLGNKFVYSRVDPAGTMALVKKAFTKLSQAKVCTKILHTSGNGLPLGAESNEKFFKALMVDIGLISVLLGLSSIKHPESKNIIFSNKGGLAEQFAGQQLRTAQAPLTDPQLFYWQRTGGRLGEIDYIIQHGNRVVPVEIKSGASGSMKSLHQFMAEKHLDFAVRCNANLPSVENLKVKTTLGQPVAYRLLSIPIYMTERLGELIEEAHTPL
ncbi:MAG: ATP-binding protein [Deltaproteobacteria bacterium]|nr:ATP-binding protein [Deltaproteobacteria bacterium]